MLSPFFSRTAPCLALLLSLSVGCLPDDDHTVGSDDAGGGDHAASDSGETCTNVPECEGVNIPVGCSVGQTVCVNGVNECGEPVCPDGGARDAGTTGADSSAPCSNVPECVGVSIPVGCTVGAPVCVSGVNECGEPVCPDGGAADAGAFACGSAGLTCDALTQFCEISLAGLPPVDGGATSFPTCQTIPTACAGNLGGAAATCACLQEHTGGTCEVSDGDDLTVTVANP